MMWKDPIRFHRKRTYGPPTTMTNKEEAPAPEEGITRIIQGQDFVSPTRQSKSERHLRRDDSRQTGELGEDRPVKHSI